MGIRRGEITTKIVSDGLIFNFDAANRASYVNGSTKTFNTINLSQVNFISFFISSLLINYSIYFLYQRTIGTRV